LMQAERSIWAPGRPIKAQLAGRRLHQPWQTLEALDIFSGAARFRPFCDGNTTSNNFFRSLRLAAPQLSQSFFTKQECTRDPVPMHNGWEVKSLTRLRT